MCPLFMAESNHRRLWSSERPIQQLGSYQLVSEPSPSTASMAPEGIAPLQVPLKEFSADLGTIIASIRHDFSRLNSSLDRCIDHLNGSRSTVVSESHHESPGFIDSDIVYEPRFVLYDEVSGVPNFSDPMKIYLPPTTPKVTRSDTSFQESPSESRSFRRVEGFIVGELSPSLPGSSLQQGISLQDDLDDSCPFAVDATSNSQVRHVDGKEASECAQVYSSSRKSQEATVGMLVQMRKTALPLRQVDDSVKEKKNIGLQSRSKASSGLIDIHEPIVYIQDDPYVKIIQEPQPKSTVASAPVVNVLVDLNSPKLGSEITLSVLISQLHHLPCFVSHDHQLFDRMPHMMVIFLNDFLTWEIEVQPGYFSWILRFLSKPPPKPPPFPTMTCYGYIGNSLTAEFKRWLEVNAYKKNVLMRTTISILPCRQAGGLTMFTPSEERQESGIYCRSNLEVQKASDMKQVIPLRPPPKPPPSMVVIPCQHFISFRLKRLTSIHMLIECYGGVTALQDLSLK